MICLSRRPHFAGRFPEQFPPSIQAPHDVGCRLKLQDPRQLQGFTGRDGRLVLLKEVPRLTGESIVGSVRSGRPGDERREIRIPRRVRVGVPAMAAAVLPTWSKLRKLMTPPTKTTDSRTVISILNLWGAGHSDAWIREVS